MDGDLTQRGRTTGSTGGMTTGDQELVAAACAGDQQAWRAIVARYERLVWAMTSTFGFDTAQRQEVAQGVWLELRLDLENVRDPNRLGSWLATTTQRAAVDTRRRSSRILPVGDAIAGALEPVWDDTRHDAARDDHAGLRAAFATLPADMQELLTLLAADPPLPYRTIAEVLGRPLGSIGPSRRRALRRLRRACVAPTGAPDPQRPSPRAGSEPNG